MKQSTVVKVTSIVLVAVMLATVCALWLPYYPNGEGETVSLARYLAFPSDHKGVTETIALQLEGYNIDSILMSALILPLAALVLLLVLLFKQVNPVLSIASAVWGLCGMIGFSRNPALLLGNASRYVFVGLSVVALAVSLCYLTYYLHEHHALAWMKEHIETLREKRKSLHAN